MRTPTVSAHTTAGPEFGAFPAGFDIGAAVAKIDEDGIVALPGAFSPEWSAELFHDLMRRGQQAKAIPNGTANRGPDRVYFSVPPETLSGFLDIATHPIIRDLATAMLGDDWQIIEVGCDLPGPGAKNQPWHRDYDGEWRAGSLAVNIPGLLVPAVTPAMGPFQIAEGTHRLNGSSFTAGMFPPKRMYKSLEQNSTRRFPRQGDISVRSALTLHRGTAADATQTAADPTLRRPVLVVGIVRPDEPADHDIYMTDAFWNALPPEVQRRVHVTHRCEQLPEIVERHDIEGLLMGA